MNRPSMNRLAVIAVAAASLALAGSAFAAASTGSAADSAWARNGARDTTTGSPIERGQAVFQNRCAICHARKEGGRLDTPGTNSLAAKYKGERPGALEDRTDLTPELVKFFVRNGAYAMPQFRKTYVTDAELDAVAAYLSRKR